MCFIGGWRDFFLVRDTYLLKGFFAFLITAAVLFFTFFSAGKYLSNYPWFARPADRIVGSDYSEDLDLTAADNPYREMDDCQLLMAPDRRWCPRHTVLVPQSQRQFHIASRRPGLLSALEITSSLSKRLPVKSINCDISIPPL